MASAAAYVIHAVEVFLDRMYVRVGDIRYMHIVSDASAVWGIVIHPVQGKDAVLLSCCLEQSSEDMSGIRCLSVPVIDVGTTGVEVSEDDMVDTIRLIIPTQHLLYHQFGLTIGRDRIGGMMFCQLSLRHTIHRSRTGKDEPGIW